MQPPPNVPSFHVCVTWQSNPEDRPKCTTLITAPIGTIRQWTYENVCVLPNRVTLKSKLCERYDLNPDNFHLVCDGVSTRQELSYEQWEVFFCSKKDPHITLELVPESDDGSHLTCFLKHRNHTFSFLDGNSENVLKMLANSLANQYQKVKEVFCKTMLVYRLDATKVMMLDKNQEPIPTGLSPLQYYEILHTEGSRDLVIELGFYQEPKLQVQVARESGYQFEFPEFPRSLDELKGNLAKGMRMKDASTISLERLGSGLVDAKTYDVICLQNNAYTVLVMHVSVEPPTTKRQRR